MFHIHKVKYIKNECNDEILEENVYIDIFNENLIELNYQNYKFDKESMENMAREAERVFATFEMDKELEELEEENYEALSERYKSYTTWELIKKMFE